MSEISRRTLLRGAVAGVGAAALGGPFAGFLARPAGAATNAARSGTSLAARPSPTCATARCGCTCPRASSTGRSTTPSSPVDARRRHHPARSPRRHGRVPGPNGNVLAGPQPRGQRPRARRSAPATPYDPMAGGGTTTIEVTPIGEVVEAFTSLNGTQMNCSGGGCRGAAGSPARRPSTGPTSAPDFTGVPNVTLDPAARLHLRGAGRRAVRPEPITAGRPLRPRGRRLRPARRHRVPHRGQLRLPVGLLPVHPAGATRCATGRLDNGGRLQMLAVEGPAQRRPRGEPADGRHATASSGSTSTIPTPTFPYTPGLPAPTTNDEAINYVGNQGRAQGAAHFSRLEGAAYDDGRGVLHLHPGRRAGRDRHRATPPTATATARARSGRTDPQTKALDLPSTSRPAPTILDLPDNVTARATGARSCCARTTPATTTSAGLTRTASCSTSP